MIKTRLLILVSLLSLPLHGTLLAAPPLRVVTSTTLIEGIVAAVGGENVTVSAVIPYAMCPGNFDLSPRTAESIAKADLFLQHGFEAFARGLTFANAKPTHVVLHATDNGMIPAVHRKITAQVVAALCAARPADAAVFRSNAEAYNRQINDAEAAIKDARKKLSGVPVLAAAMNASFVAWAGCNVVGTFPRDDSLSAHELVALLKQGKNENVRLIVDNQQSLGRTGKKIATELGAPIIVLSNFPQTSEGGYPTALKNSLDHLVDQLASTTDTD